MQACYLYVRDRTNMLVLSFEHRSPGRTVVPGSAPFEPQATNNDVASGDEISPGHQTDLANGSGKFGTISLTDAVQIKNSD